MLGNINCSVLNYKKIGVKVELQSIWMLKMRGSKQSLVLRGMQILSFP